MLEKKDRTIITLTILISVIVLIAVAILVMVDRRRLGQPMAESGWPDYHEVSSELPAEPAKPGTKPIRVPDEKLLSKPPAGTIAESAAGTKSSLADVIRRARTWGPAFGDWIGKSAPDFTLTDTTGRQHKLSDYRGRDVLITFWATWCSPCRVEIPHLIALRNIIGEDKLAMLAISSEPPNIVREFAARRRINYTILSDPGTMPAPFDRISSIPCSFFIDAEGKIKLATVGTLSLGAIKAIFRAE